MFKDNNDKIMRKKSVEFLRKMLEFFPSTQNEYFESINKYGEVLETIIIEDIFMPEVLKQLNENSNVELLEAIFKYFEEVANCDDQHLHNIFSVTVLEILGNDKSILEKARRYMGSKTIQLQIDADRELGRV